MKTLGIAFGLGLLAALALPPVHAVPVLLVSIPGLLLLVGRAPNWRRAALIGLFWGWGQGIGGMYWITYAILTEVERYWWLVPIAVPALALPFGAFVALPAGAARLVPAGGARLLVFAGAWVAAELLRGVVPFGGFPWNLLGSVWAFDALPLQGAAYVGVHGLSLVTVLLAGLPLLGWRARAAGGLAFLGLAGLGLARLAPAEPPPQDLQLLLVQGNVAQEVKWREDQRAPIFGRYLALTAAALEAMPDAATPIAVIWPEAASPYRLAEDAEARAAAARVLRPGAVLLAGAVTVEWSSGGLPLRLFNSLVAVTPDGGVAGRFDKVRLVPFGEYMPLRGLIPVRLVQGNLDFNSGPGLVAMAPAGIPAFSALICYEVIFPGSVVGATRPSWMLNVTNDAWFGQSAGPYQHLAAARMRAVEEGLPIARAAQTGISAVYNSRGRTVVRLGLGEQGSIATRLPAAAAATWFARGGLLIPAGLALLALGAGGGLARRQKRFSRPSHE